MRAYGLQDRRRTCRGYTLQLVGENCKEELIRFITCRARAFRLGFVLFLFLFFALALSGF